MHGLGASLTEAGRDELLLQRNQTNAALFGIDIIGYKSTITFHISSIDYKSPADENIIIEFEQISL